jgi:hypothetical protein
MTAQFRLAKPAIIDIDIEEIADVTQGIWHYFVSVFFDFG